jgi:transcriptional regulator with XRE-family HTH domain
MVSIAQTVRYRRAKLGLTQEQLAQRAGVHVSTIIKAEAGKHRPTGLSLVKIESALELPDGSLFTEIASDRPTDADALTPSNEPLIRGSSPNLHPSVDVSSASSPLAGGEPRSFSPSSTASPLVNGGDALTASTKVDPVDAPLGSHPSRAIPTPVESPQIPRSRRSQA